MGALRDIAEEDFSDAAPSDFAPGTPPFSQQNASTGNFAVNEDDSGLRKTEQTSCSTDLSTAALLLLCQAPQPSVVKKIEKARQKRNKHSFVNGNYRSYYRYRHDGELEDPRLQVHSFFAEGDAN